jgi:uncharacterized protein YndB with AHSA1/START domain
MPSTTLSRRGINRKELRSEIEIDAPPERVWESLIDSPDIPQPVRSAIGERRVGEQLKVHLKPRGGRGATFRIKLLRVEPGRELRWRGHLWVRGLFDGEHTFEIKPLSDRRAQ